MSALQFITHTIPQLSSTQLYHLMRLRTDVFVVEQQCAYPEVDETDAQAHHVLGYYQEQLVACARLVPPGLSYAEPSIGRVAVAAAYRGRGWGRLVFEYAFRQIKAHYPQRPVKIQAQQYLEPFYKSVGFRTVSKPYPDVGIMHVDMLYSLLT